VGGVPGGNTPALLWNPVSDAHLLVTPSCVPHVSRTIMLAFPHSDRPSAPLLYPNLQKGRCLHVCGCMHA